MSDEINWTEEAEKVRRELLRGGHSLDEGWWLSSSGIGEYYLVPYGKDFATTEDAIEFVRARAEAGSRLHQRALLVHAASRVTGGFDDDATVEIHLEDLLY